MATEVTYARSTRTHTVELAASMRIEDVEEVWASHRHTPLQALEGSLEASDVALTCFFDGVVAAMYGVCVTERGTVLGGPQAGRVWILTGEACSRHPREYLRQSKKVISALLEYCPRLFNFIDARHQPALRWARWAGLTLFAPVPLGPFKASFIPFEVRHG